MTARLVATVLPPLGRIDVRQAGQKSFQRHWKGNRSATGPSRKERVDIMSCRSARLCFHLSIQNSSRVRQRNDNR